MNKLLIRYCRWRYKRLHAKMKDQERVLKYMYLSNHEKDVQRARIRYTQHKAAMWYASASYFRLMKEE